MEEKDKKTIGAWIVHHSNKLYECRSPQFEDIELAGKCASLLSSIVATDEIVVKKEVIGIMGKIAGISKGEMPTVLGLLKDKRLIDQGASGDVAALGLTTPGVLMYTAEIFEDQIPSAEENASIYIAEKASQSPQESKVLSEEVGDYFKLKKQQVNDLFILNEQIGFVDFEKIDDHNSLLFNGNLFRIDNANKAVKILDSLSTADSAKVSELNDSIKNNGCIEIDEAIKLVGKSLFGKLNAIGMFDISVVSNTGEAVQYVSSPGSYAKYASHIDDAFDLAKALVASLKYGMTRSHYARGRILSLEALMRKLINGGSVGPTDSIGQDYRYLEMKGVVEIRQDTVKIGRFHMRLLKKDIGELALTVLTTGSASEAMASKLNSASAPNFSGPEINRVISRREVKMKDEKVIDFLRTVKHGNK